MTTDASIISELKQLKEDCRSRLSPEKNQFFSSGNRSQITFWRCEKKKSFIFFENFRREIFQKNLNFVLDENFGSSKQFGMDL